MNYKTLKPGEKLQIGDRYYMDGEWNEVMPNRAVIGAEVSLRDNCERPLKGDTDGV